MRKDRLLKLLKHMEGKNLSVTEFNFAYYRRYFHKGNEPASADNFCKTKGCMAGELPFLFPKDWMFDQDLIPVPLLKKNSTSHPTSDLEKFFGLTDKEVHRLFYGRTPFSRLNAGSILPRNSSLKRVTNNLRRFLIDNGGLKSSSKLRKIKL